jgi:hypothetical protein
MQVSHFTFTSSNLDTQCTSCLMIQYLSWWFVGDTRVHIQCNLSIVINKRTDPNVTTIDRLLLYPARFNVNQPL